LARNAASNLARNAGIDPHIVSAIGKDLEKKKATGEKSCSEEATICSAEKKPESKPMHQDEPHTPEKMDRREFAAKLIASGNRLDKI
jgi:hypothetical protein